MLRNMEKDPKRKTATRLFPAAGKSKGFTLIETLIAILLLSIGLLGMGTLLYSVMGYNEYAETVTTATTLAQDKLEDLKTADYSSIVVESPVCLDENGSVGGIYCREISSVSETTLTNMRRFKEITVKVSWNWKGDAKNIAVTTIIRE